MINDFMGIDQKRVLRKITTIRKNVLFGLQPRHQNTIPIFILGCGRSGTTMMLDIFHDDERIEVLGEKDRKIASKKFLLRYEKLGAAIYHSKASVMVMKPILNSFDAKRLLTQYENSIVLWVIRDYRDMIASSVKKFGNRVAGFMRDLLLDNSGDNWIATGMPTDTQKRLQNIVHKDFTNEDWMGLVWWSVNYTVLRDRLHQFDRFKLIEYEMVVRNKDILMNKIYHSLGMKLTKRSNHPVHPDSIGKGACIKLDPIVDSMCKDLKNVLANYSMR